MVAKNMPTRQPVSMPSPRPGGQSTVLPRSELVLGLVFFFLVLVVDEVLFAFVEFLFDLFDHFFDLSGLFRFFFAFVEIPFDLFDHFFDLRRFLFALFRRVLFDLLEIRFFDLGPSPFAAATRRTLGERLCAPALCL